MFISSSRSHSQVGRVRMSHSELNKDTLSFRQGRQVSPRQAVMDAYGCRRHPFCDYSYKSNGEQKRNRSNKESDFVLPCYNYSSCE